MSGKKAVGVDGVNKEQYARQLEKNVEELVTRMKWESCRPKPSRRVYIDKPGSKKKRPLGAAGAEGLLTNYLVL